MGEAVMAEATLLQGQAGGTLSDAAAQVLGIIIGRYGSEDAALAAIAEMSVSELNVLLYTASAGSEIDVNAVNEAREVLMDVQAQAIASAEDARVKDLTDAIERGEPLPQEFAYDTDIVDRLQDAGVLEEEQARERRIEVRENREARAAASRGSVPVERDVTDPEFGQQRSRLREQLEEGPEEDRTYAELRERKPEIEVIGETDRRTEEQRAAPIGEAAARATLEARIRGAVEAIRGGAQRGQAAGQFPTGSEVEQARLRASGRYRQLLDRGGDISTAFDPQTGEPLVPIRGAPLGGYVSPRPVRPVPLAQRAAGMTPDQAAREAAYGQPDTREPLYYPGDEMAPAAWSEIQIAQLQRRLVEAGLLTTTFRRGYWDAATAKGYTALLTHANAEATTWADVLPRVQRAHEAGVDVARAQAASGFADLLPVFTPEDPATLRRLVRDAVRDRVGREPSSAELATFTGQLSDYYRQQYDAEVSDARAMIEQQSAKLAGEIDPSQQLLSSFDAGDTTVSAAGAAGAGTPSTSLEPPPPTAPAVNPGDRLAEALDARLRPEVSLLDRKAQAGATQATVSAIAGNLLRRAGGSA